ncbi:MAG: ClpX C4-type zinc finger protein [Treponema sp.]|jgi:hypothetical protein|nr:ClpX C4-type zinc finger protein [Treponema sp.]
MAKKKSEPQENTNASPKKAAPERFCSFCGKSSNNAYRMIAGPPIPSGQYEVSICDEWVNVWVKLLLEESDALLWIPVVSQHHVFTEYLGTKWNFPSAKTLDRSWHIAYLAPHNKKFDAIFSAHIVPQAEQKSLDVIRLPAVYGKRKSIYGIMKNVYESVILIADVSGKESDVLYILGMAHLTGKPLVILSQNPADIPIDLKKDRQIIYENSDEGLKVIDYHISHMFELVSHEKKADALLPCKDTLSDPLNYPAPPMPKQRKKKK